MSETILLTGGTGHIGSALIPRLLRNPDTRILAVIRARDEEHLAQRRARLVEATGISSARLGAVRGDISAPELGFSSRDRERVLDEVTSILHSAASVRFDLPEDTAASQNLEATRSVVQLAQTLAETGRLGRYDHISTCYVAGDRTGRVFEHENDEGQGFRNSYEWSKCQAEKIVRTAIDRGLPAAIHRPAIVVGDSETGQTHSFNVIYWPLKLYIRGWWRTFPGCASAPTDIVPVDFVAEAIARIRSNPATLGRCFHLAVGDEAPTVGELVDTVRQITGGPPLRYVDQSFYRSWLRPLMLPLYVTDRGRTIKRGGDAFMPYFEHNPIFDTTNAREVLGDLRPPSVLEYLGRVIRYAIERDFRAA